MDVEGAYITLRQILPVSFKQNLSNTALLRSPDVGKAIEVKRARLQRAGVVLCYYWYLVSAGLSVTGKILSRALHLHRRTDKAELATRYLIAAMMRAENVS